MQIKLINRFFDTNISQSNLHLQLSEKPKKNYSIHSKITATKERHFSKANKAYVSIKMKINFNKLLKHS